LESLDPHDDLVLDGSNQIAKSLRAPNARKMLSRPVSRLLAGRPRPARIAGTLRTAVPSFTRENTDDDSGGSVLDAPVSPGPARVREAGG
jgi:hypothetical protein